MWLSWLGALFDPKELHLILLFTTTVGLGLLFLHALLEREIGTKNAILSYFVSSKEQHV